MKSDGNSVPSNTTLLRYPELKSVYSKRRIPTLGTLKRDPNTAFQCIRVLNKMFQSDFLLYPEFRRYKRILHCKCYHTQEKVTWDRPKIKVRVGDSYLARTRFMQFLKNALAGSFDPSTLSSKNGTFSFRFWFLCKKSSNPLFLREALLTST